MSPSGHRSIKSIFATIALALAVVLGLVASPTLSALGAPSDEGLYVVRFEARITDASRAALERTGVVVIDYEPDNSYLVWASTVQAETAAALNSVRLVSPLSVERKLDESVSGDVGAIAYAEVTFFGPTLRPTVASLSQFGHLFDVYAARADGLLFTAEMSLDAGSLAAVAQNSAVMYISQGTGLAVPEDERGTQIVAGNIKKTPDGNQPVPGYVKWLKKIGLNGKGITVSIVDTGISRTHPDVEDRVVKHFDYSPAGEPSDTQGHGTHVTGIVGGEPFDPELKDPDGFLYGQGVAPRTKFIDQNAISLTGTLDEPIGNFPPEGGFEVLSRDAWKTGARMWNASWHTAEGSRAGYLASVRAMDEIARNAVFKKEGREEFLLVFSAGNAGSNGPTVPKEAKNLISVGSSKSGRGPHWPLTEDIDEISTFSSKGPTKDGRIFPTVSAPGETVISARTAEGALAATCTSPLDALPFYCAFSGTSMAAPHVAGSSALIHQWWKRKHGELPSPAMVKALLVNSATDIGFKDIPNMNEGWGRINLGELFARTPSRYVDQKVTFHRRGQHRCYPIKIRRAGSRLKVTLAWADAPAAVGAEKVLVNDLDLMVKKMSGGRPVAEWKGNVFKKGWSVTGGKPDRLNNVENVYLNDLKPGLYRVWVKSINVPGDGIPENGDKTDQDFALVARTFPPRN